MLDGLELRCAPIRHSHPADSFIGLPWSRWPVRLEPMPIACRSLPTVAEDIALPRRPSLDGVCGCRAAPRGL